MPLNSHRRYQKAHYIEVNHERGCLFEHILVPTLPEFQSKLRELRQRARSACFVSVIQKIKNNRDFPLSHIKQPKLV